MVSLGQQLEGRLADPTPDLSSSPAMVIDDPHAVMPDDVGLLVGGPDLSGEFFTDIPRLLPDFDDNSSVDSWRSKDRKMKALSVGVVLCLNIGVAPPDVVKTNPCAKQECWIDPTTMTPQKAIEAIGQKLAQQYVRWQPKAKCKQSLDPTLDDLKRLCCALRRRAKDEPAVLHYNGHGVPRPTNNGELWVFNKNYTQYLPVSVYDLQTWMGSPSIFVYDCSSAGVIVKSFNRFAEQREADYKKKVAAGLVRMPGNFAEPLRTCIQLAACGEDETLPTNPALPADIFTACLTTPVEMAIRWAYTMGQNHLLPRVTAEMIEQIPGQLNDRRTMKGQLNWIFTAITDTIAWHALSNELFHQLFRNDLLVAALFRNFLLAERIMRKCNCTPVSSPQLPPTHDHPLWQAWDMAVEGCLSQLPAMIEHGIAFENCSFFSDQLTAFEVWLNMSGRSDPNPPEQLPVVLQVLLSQHHRVRALKLLEGYLSLGPAAVRGTLSVGIFPYVFKLLGSPAQELREVLISIWTKVLAVDGECKIDLLRPPASTIRKTTGAPNADKGIMYFISTLANLDQQYSIRLRTMAAFVITMFVDKHPKGQEVCFCSDIISIVLPQMSNENPALRQWCCLLLGKCWQNQQPAKLLALEQNVIDILVALLKDDYPNVRTSAVLAMGTLIGKYRESFSVEEEITINVERIGMKLLNSVDDGSHVVRTEVAAAFCPLVILYHDEFVSAAASLKEHGHKNQAPNFFLKILKGIFMLASDPYPAVTEAAMGLLGPLGITTPKSRRQSMNIPRASDPKTISSSLSTSINALRAVTVPRKKVYGSVAASISSPDLVIPNSVGSPNWLQFKPPAARKQQQQPLPEDISGDADLHAEGLISTIREIVGKLTGQQTRTNRSKWRGNNHTLPDLSQGDIEDALRHPINSVLAIFPPVESVFEQFGWTGTSFSGTVDADMLCSLAEAVKEAIVAEREVQADLHVVSTNFFQWCCSSFCEWTRRLPEKDLVALAEAKSWRKEHHESVMRESFNLISMVSESKLKLNETIFHTRTSELSNEVLFHAFEPILVMANAASGNVSVWNTSRLVETSKFCAANPKKGRLTSMKLINEDESSLLAVGSSDGVVRLWENYWKPQPTLLTTWRAVSKMLESKEGSGSGLVMEWIPRQGTLLATGDVPYIQMWDAMTQSRIQRIPTEISSCVTSMCADHVASDVVLTGFGDGSVILFDVRMKFAAAQNYTQHESWVVNVHIQRGGGRHYLSGSKAGDILWWDPRFASQPVRTVKAHKLKKGDTMTAFAVHNYASLFATATPNQYIKVFDMEGNLLNHHKHYTNFLGECIGPNSCLQFHPTKPYLATGSYEQLLSIYAPST